MLDLVLNTPLIGQWKVEVWAVDDQSLDRVVIIYIYRRLTLTCNNAEKWLNILKAAVTDMRNFARSKFFGSLVHKKNFGLI